MTWAESMKVALGWLDKVMLYLKAGLCLLFVLLLIAGTAYGIFGGPFIVAVLCFGMIVILTAFNK